MRRAHGFVDFFICVALNMIFSFKMTLPAWLLLVAHLVLGTPLSWCFYALAAWAVYCAAVTAMLSWAASSGRERPAPPNINPYSSRK